MDFCTQHHPLMERGSRKTLSDRTLAVVVLLQRNCNALRVHVGSPPIEAWAKSIGIGYGSLHRLLTGSEAPSGPDRPPNLDTIVRVAAAHHIEPWKLLHPHFDPGAPDELAPESTKLSRRSVKVKA